MKARRQVGFIKNYANKTANSLQDQNTRLQQLPTRNQNDQDQFSPYKFEAQQTSPPKITASKPPLPSKSRGSLLNKIKSSDKLLHKIEDIRRNSTQKLKQYTQNSRARDLPDKIDDSIPSSYKKIGRNKAKIHQDIGNLKTQLQELDSALKKIQITKQPLQTSQMKQRRPDLTTKLNYRFQQDSQSSEQQVVQRPIPPPQQLSQKRPLQRTFNKQQRRNSSQQQSSPDKILPDNRRNLITFKPRQNLVVQIEEYSSCSEAEDQFIQARRNYNQSGIKQQPPSQFQHNKFTISRDDFRSKKAICFEIDVKQFAKASASKQERGNQQKKVKKVDKKAQLLKRRQAAKIYDKMARQALFTPSN